jgi:hypothetical protein
VPALKNYDMKRMGGMEVHFHVLLSSVIFKYTSYGAIGCDSLISSNFELVSWEKYLHIFRRDVEDRYRS